MRKSEILCDLHLHSFYSDGDLSPVELVKRGGLANLAAVSVTDHDTIAGQAEAARAGLEYDVEVITGIEFSVREDRFDIHILGYLFDPEDPELVICSKALEEARYNRARAIVKKLNGLNVDITMKEVSRISGRGAIGRLHIARLLLEQGYISNIQEAFTRYIGEGRPACVPRKILTVGAAVSIIRNAGGVAVWAHPGSNIRRRNLVDAIIGSGISGLEAWHPNHTPELTKRICSEARSRGLVCTGGSDYHFTEAMKADIGGISVPYESVSRLRKMI